MKQSGGVDPAPGAGERGSAEAGTCIHGTQEEAMARVRRIAERESDGKASHSAVWAHWAVAGKQLANVHGSFRLAGGVERADSGGRPRFKAVSEGREGRRSNKQTVAVNM